MSDRLNELRRQRALVQEHLAWLEREIAATENQTSGNAGSTTPSVPAAKPSPWSLVQPRQTEPRAAAPGPTDALFDQYRVEPSSVKSDVRKGCFLYFALAFVLLGLGVSALWLAFRR